VLPVAPLVEVGAGARPLPVEAVEVEPRRAEVDQRVGIVQPAELGDGVERDVVVDELPDEGLAVVQRRRQAPEQPPEAPLEERRARDGLLAPRLGDAVVGSASSGASTSTRGSAVLVPVMRQPLEPVESRPVFGRGSVLWSFAAARRPPPGVDE
jgi:hypothetical protein